MLLKIEQGHGMWLQDSYVMEVNLFYWKYAMHNYILPTKAGIFYEKEKKKKNSEIIPAGGYSVGPKERWEGL